MTAFAGFFGLTALGFWAVYLVLGWLTGGVVIWLRAVQGNANRTMAFCLALWWLAWAAVLLSAMTGLALKVFDPDHGPVAFGWQLLRSLFAWSPVVRPLVRESPKP